ncbi:hypothetical protein ZC03_004 [Pseudomonas phage ZC03]|uniref:Uncharacterized protein n=1 Tax=Pseudomonas phage ZC03 TaxID=1622115 RepID=A0A1L2C911_9CAUD|nr:hypothetical protein HWA93_gp04 [Pseudomonas phage ZC03]AMD43391.1 hypothetical protein ZC03_004 [Pseudomonas phage ZC03]
MATVTLTWQIEGVHDGIGVYRSNQIDSGYEQVAVLAPNTTVFQDEFLLSQLTDKYGTEPETLFYRLDAFRGLDVKQSDPVPVPLEDTMPEFLDGVGYLEVVPELKFGDMPATYYNVGVKSFNDGNYHVLFGLRRGPSLFITDPQNGNAPFTEVNQFLRNMPFNASNLEEAIAITTMAKQQYVLESAADIQMDAMSPFIFREEPILEILPTAEMMQEMQSDILALVAQESLTGYFWTSTMSPSATNEFGQVVDIDVDRFSVAGDTESVSILGSDQAMTLVFVLIKDITPLEA